MTEPSKTPRTDALGISVDGRAWLGELVDLCRELESALSDGSSKMALERDNALTRADELEGGMQQIGELCGVMDIDGMIVADMVDLVREKVDYAEALHHALSSEVVQAEYAGGDDQPQTGWYCSLCDETWGASGPAHAETCVLRRRNEIGTKQRQGADSPTSATIDPSADQDHAPARNNAQSTVGALQEATETPSVQSAPATNPVHAVCHFPDGRTAAEEIVWRMKRAIKMFHNADLHWDQEMIADFRDDAPKGMTILDWIEAPSQSIPSQYSLPAGAWVEHGAGWVKVHALSSPEAVANLRSFLTEVPNERK